MPAPSSTDSATAWRPGSRTVNTVTGPGPEASRSVMCSVYARTGDLLRRRGKLEAGNWKLGTGSWGAGSWTPSSRPPGVVLQRQLEAVAVLAAEEVVGRRRVGHAHVLGVVVDLAPRAERDHAEQHHFDETRRVFERARGLGRALGRLDPVHLVRRLDALDRLLRRAVRVVQRLRQQARLVAVGVVQQLALAAEVHYAPFAGELLLVDHPAVAIGDHFVAELHRTRRHHAAVVPRQLDRRLVAAS